MEHDFWLKRWQENRIGFHLNEINPHLKKHGRKFISPESNVLIPLCGKSIDLIYLTERTGAVIGVELSQQAIAQFIAENSLTPETNQIGNHVFYTQDNLTLVCGDFFTLDKANLPPCDVIYDRAALVALPESMRVDYITQCKNLSTADATTLLITLEHSKTNDDGSPAGPPFPIVPEHVNHLFNQHSIELLERIDNLDEGESGASAEYVFAIR